MTSPELERLADSGLLSREEPSAAEIEGLARSGSERLADARKESLSYPSRFDLAYNAAHALSLAALRLAGYRADRRYIVFQALPQTLGLGASVWRVLAQAHSARNRAEYEGLLLEDERLLAGLLEATSQVEHALRDLRQKQR